MTARRRSRASATSTPTGRCPHAGSCCSGRRACAPPSGARSCATCSWPALVGVAFAAGLSFFVARSIVGPIRRVAAAARTLTLEDRPAPLPEAGTTEIASLARAFNEMAAELADSRDAERAFLLSVSHELKTPLTAIRGYAEGLADGAFGADEAAAHDRARGGPARAARSRPARPRADEPQRVLDQHRAGGRRRPSRARPCSGTRSRRATSRSR